MRRKALFLVLAAVFAVVPLGSALADDAYVNPETGYRVVIEDDAGLISAEEESAVRERMEPLTEYGNAAFKTVSENSRTAKGFAEDYYYGLFGNESGIVFLIDMDNRMLYIAADGRIYETVTDERSETITDNVYRMASNEDYAGCAEEVFRQSYALLRGERIAQPMKYICSALLALGAGLLVCFEYANRKSASGASDKELLAAAAATFAAGAIVPELTGTTKKYSPQTSSSSGGGGGHFSSGGHSGGGHFSGGGGHSSGGGHFSGGGGGHKF